MKERVDNVLQLETKEQTTKKIASSRNTSSQVHRIIIEKGFETYTKAEEGRILLSTIHQ